MARFAESNSAEQLNNAQERPLQWTGRTAVMVFFMIDGIFYALPDRASFCPFGFFCRKSFFAS